MPAGGTVEFLNSDRLLHNIHSAARANTGFNRTQPRGRTIPITFAKSEIIPISCDLHGWMRAWVVVMEHPFYAVTGSEGEFALDNVPPGFVQPVQLFPVPWVNVLYQTAPIEVSDAA